MSERLAKRFEEDRKTVDIHRVAAEMPENKPPDWFDAEREITPSDWRTLKENLESEILKDSNDNDQLMTYAEDATTLALLFPQKRHELHIPPDIGVRLQSVLHGNTDYHVELLVSSMLLRVLAPELIDKMLEGNTQSILNKLDTHARGGHWVSYFTDASNLAMLSPKAVRPWSADQQASSGGEWEKLVELLHEATDEGDIMRRVLVVRILFPDRGADIRLDAKTLRFFRTQLDQYRRKKRWDDFAACAVALKIATAERIDITERGLDITMPPKIPLTATIPPLPEQRSY